MGFFDKLKEQASGVSAQLQDTLKGSKFATQLNSLQNTRKQQVSDLGEAILNMYRQGGLNEAALQAQVQQIFDTERQIIATQEAIEAERQAAAEAKLAQQQARQAAAPRPRHRHHPGRPPACAPALIAVPLWRIRTPSFAPTAAKPSKRSRRKELNDYPLTSAGRKMGNGRGPTNTMCRGTTPPGLSK